MENREKSPRVVVIDRREDHGVLLTRRTAGRYGAEACLRLPATYRKIGEEAFKGNIKIERLELPDSVLELGEHAFQHCNALKEAHLPEHLARIGAGCFAECPRLRLAEIPTYVEILQAGTFLEDRKLQEVRFAAESRLAVIGEDAFAECTALERISLPDSVTKIGDRAFRRCKSLAEIHFRQAYTYRGRSILFLRGKGAASSGEGCVCGQPRILQMDASGAGDPAGECAVLGRWCLPRLQPPESAGNQARS